jgi:MFS family permease
MVGTAVGIFIYYGMQMKPFDYMDKEALETEYGVEGMVRDRMERYNPSHIKFMIIGVLLCVLSCIPIFVAMILGENEWNLIIGVCLLLIMVAVGVLLIVRTNIIMEAMKSLLEEGEFSRENKRESRRNEAIMTIYWLTAIVIFLAFSFLTNRWDRSWIIWPVAGIGCGILTAVLKVVRSRE